MNAKVNGSNVELTWNPIATPHALDMDYLKAYFSNAYKNADWANSAAQTRYNENVSSLGSVVYKVYEQSGDDIKLVATVDGNKATVTPTKSDVTYIVKSSYVGYERNMSDGISTKVTGVKVKDQVTATQNINEATVAAKDTKLKDESKIATVSLNGVPVPASRVTYDYKLDNTKVSGDTYELSVKVIYNRETVATYKINITVK